VLTSAYASFGFFWGTWAVIFSDFLATRSLTPGQMSAPFTVLSVMAIAVMVVGAPRLESWPRRLSIAVALGFHAAGAALIALAPVGWLVAAFVVTGIGTGLVDVFINAAAQEVEAEAQRPVLQWVHAGYSSGAAAGALGAGLALNWGARLEWLLALAAIVQAAAAGATLMTTRLRAAGVEAPKRSATSLRVFVRHRFLLVPAGVLLAAFFVEGLMDVWSVIYLRRELDASALAGSGGFAAFALAMAAGRSFAARVLFGLGYRRTVMLSGVVSMICGAIIVGTQDPMIASFGFLVLGFAIAWAAPAAFGIAGGARTRAWSSPL